MVQILVLFLVTFGNVIGPKKITKKSSLLVKSSASAKSIHLCVSNRESDRFLDRKSTKMINNRNIIGLNQMGRLKHQIEIFFGQST